MQPTSAPSWTDVLKTTFRVLTFRASREEMEFGNAYLAFGLLCTWIAGVGRSWDDASASLLRKSGVGSVIYIFGLSLLLWLVVRPLCEGRCSYRRVLTFVSLTSILGILYAIPVERFLSRETSLQINMMFLAVVAVWRVSLLVFYLRRGVELSGDEVAVATLLPLAIVMTPLTIFNFLNSIAEAMSGLREQGEANPMAPVVGFLGAVAILALIPLLISHQAMAWGKRRKNATL